ncbi:MAG TPA: hypothetical protein DDX39_03820 [Bacteroidales bacterium]|nr:MAG: hypothetical protein A2W98_08980 [Bacteroidetes bacterium GWF2_33_38]OFY90129.1 MAG: hypothetical protein A2236_10140 [Bacteroidetes bacterium RIFOXYA2_FULL_33_7]HBF87749.1 hypothetical protein [Bacteroidales bacterium]
MCAFSQPNPASSLLTYERETEAFVNLNIDGNFNLYVFEGNSDVIVIETDSLSNQLLKTNVHDSTLFISSIQKVKEGRAINIFLTTRKLKTLTAVGNSDLTFYPYVADNIHISLPESDSDLKLKTTTNSFNCTLSGYGFIIINGYYNDLTATITDEVSLTLNVLTNNLTCNIQDFGFAILNGTTQIFNVNMEDESYMKAFNMYAVTCNIDISGIGEAHVNVVETMNVTARNDSQVKYRGTPTINILDKSKDVCIKNKKTKSNYAEKEVE